MGESVNNENIEKVIEEVLTADAFITVNKKLIQIFGLEAAVLIGELLYREALYKQNQKNWDGWFYFTETERRRVTGITQNKQKVIIETLKQAKILETIKKGNPGRIYFRINKKQIFKILSGAVTAFQVFENPESGNYINKKDNNKKDIILPKRKDISPPRAVSSETMEKDIKAVMKSKQSQKAIPNAPLVVKRILRAWNTVGAVKHKEAATKTYANAVAAAKKLLAGTFFENNVDKKWIGRKFTEEEVMLSLERFAKATKDPAYLPEDKTYHARSSFVSFLFNAWIKRSWFLEYLENEPEELITITDNRPELTNALISVFRRKVLGGTSGDIQRNKFISGSRKIQNFLRRNRRKIPSVYIRTEEDIASLVINSLIEHFKDQSITPGHICSDYTFETVLPAYLVKQGVIDA